MITINRKNPTEGEVTSSLTNAESGGLHFDGTAGYVTCGDSAILDGATKLSIEVIISTTSTTEGRIIAKQFDAIAYALRNDAAGTLTASIGNGSSNVNVSTSGTYNDGKPHHVVVTWDNATIKIYVDGKQDGSGTLAGGSIQNTSDFLELGARAKSGSRNSFFKGFISRARLHNRVIDAKTAFENQNIDYSEQWGNQTNKFSAAVDKNWGTNQSDTGNDANDRATFDAAYVWGMAGSPTDISVASNVLTFSTAGASNGIFYPSVLSAGKKFRATINVGSVTGSAAYKIQYYSGSAYVDVHTLTSGVNTVEFTPSATNGTIYILATSGTAGTLALNAASTVNSLVQSGCISSYELQSANPTQSLMVQDSSGAADGTCSASGVSQINGITQVNAVAARIGSAGGPETPADGELISKKLKVTSNGNGEIICERQSGAAAIIQSQAAAVKVGSSSNHELQFMTNNIVRAEIDTAGNVGIGGSAFGDLTVYKNATPTKINLQNSTSTNAANKGLEFYLSGNNAGIHNWQNGSMNFATNNVNRLTISSAGNVGIATSSPRAIVDFGPGSGDGTLSQTISEYQSVYEAPQGTGDIGRNIGFAVTTTGISAAINAIDDGGSNATALGFSCGVSGNISEHMRITYNGYSLYNCTSVPSTSVAGLALYGASGGSRSSSGSATTSYQHFLFINGNGTVGSISTDASATIYATSSDHRLKENLTPLTGALDRIEQLPVYRFNFKSDTETTVDGFVAHEAQAIVPEAVIGEKDAMKTVVVQEAVEAVEYQAAIEAVEYQPATYYEEGDELPEGVEVGDIKTEEIQAVQGQPEIEAVVAQEEVTEEQPDYQGIDQSKLVPLLVAAVKELKAKVEALESA